MANVKLYLDTSVISAFFDLGKPVRQLITQKWVENDLKNFTVYASTLVIDEIDSTKDLKLRFRMIDFVKNNSIQILNIDDEIIELANQYRTEILPKEINDTLHLACASANNIEVLVSWNFRHIVNYQTINIIHKVNLQNNYNIIEVLSPLNLGGSKYGNL